MRKMLNLGKGVGQGGLYWDNKNEEVDKKDIGHPLRPYVVQREFEEVWREIKDYYLR